MYCIRPDPLRESMRVWLRETIGLRGLGVVPTVDIASAVLNRAHKCNVNEMNTGKVLNTGKIIINTGKIIAHYEYHYLSSGAFAENRAIATLSSVISFSSSLPLLLLYLSLVAKVAG